MLTVILSWIYISALCVVVGKVILSGQNALKQNSAYCMMAGMLVITVYAEFFSLFAKVGMAAHLILLALTAAACFWKRDCIKELVRSGRSLLFSWEGFFYCGFILLTAFFTSRGEFHTDTNIYHAQAVRLYEESRVITGIGNLQLHYAYNSSYLAFASIFSLKWLTGQSLHVTTGWMETVLGIYAFHGLRHFKEHKSHLADMMKVGILFYILVILVRSMSPATDFATILYALFIMAAWCDISEGEGGSHRHAAKQNVQSLPAEDKIKAYGCLSVAAVYVATMKFSAALLVLIALYPAFYLVKGKQWKQTAAFLTAGIIVLCPFLLRNYLISGWLLYPFDKIDIFHVDWKVPKEYLLQDARQIEVWGKCLYDVAKADWKVSEWFPVWWEGQQRYEWMFLLGVVPGAALQGVMLLVTAAHRQKIRMEIVVLVAAVWGNLAFWFLKAPFIRYGLAFLFAAIMLAAGEYLSRRVDGFAGIVAGTLFFCIIMCVSPYWDNYIKDAGVFVKQHLKDPYYLKQQDYDKAQMDTLEIDGVTIYYPVSGEMNSYHAYPSVCYRWMAERNELREKSFEDGFRAK